MARKRNLLNVREHLENELIFLDILLEGKSIELPPALRMFATERHLFTRAILRKHAEKKTRKDIYVETKTKS